MIGLKIGNLIAVLQDEASTLENKDKLDQWFSVIGEGIRQKHLTREAQDDAYISALASAIYYGYVHRNWPWD